MALLPEWPSLFGTRMPTRLFQGVFIRYENSFVSKKTSRRIGVERRRLISTSSRDQIFTFRVQIRVLRKIHAVTEKSDAMGDGTES